MSAGTSIEWTHIMGFQPGTWNWIIGCSRVSAACGGCDKCGGVCYAIWTAYRLEHFLKMPQYRGLTEINEHGERDWTGQLNRNSDEQFYLPLHTRSPTAWFTCSMSDFFHSGCEPEWRAEALEIMARTPHHLYLILTKRPAEGRVQLERLGVKLPSNVWLGATVEDYRVVNRIEKLRRIPSAKRFLSVEPMLAPLGPVNLEGIDWVITGGQSKYNAQPIRVEWVREVRDQCLKAGVRYFHKQWGTPKFNPLAAECPPGMSLQKFIAERDPHGKGGALLDGKLWREFPPL